MVFDLFVCKTKRIYIDLQLFIDPVRQVYFWKLCQTNYGYKIKLVETVFIILIKIFRVFSQDRKLRHFHGYDGFNDKIDCNTFLYSRLKIVAIPSC